MTNAFFELFESLPRQGPGNDESRISACSGKPGSVRYARIVGYGFYTMRL